MAKKSLVSPRGIAVFPRLSGKPDTKFNAEGVWKTGLRIPAGPDADAFKQMLDEEHTASLAAAKKETPGKKWSKGNSPYTVEENGDVLVNFTMNAKYEDKKTKEVRDMRPALFDAGKKPFPDTVRIGGGTELKVAYTVGYTTFITPKRAKNPEVPEAFVKLYLNAAQILNLVEFAADGGKYGFEDESDEDAATDSTSESEEATDDADEGDDAEATDF